MNGAKKMKITKIIALASITGVVAAGAITTPALAWHPKGVIIKSVQNQTAGSALADANTSASAVNAKTGDVLKYVIEIRNDGAAHAKGWNDMHFTKLTDTLPAGVELVSDPAKRQITEDLGVIKAGAKVTKEYIVKVTSTKNADVIENKACFTGDSEVKDQPQKGCDPAIVKVTVPPVVVEPPVVPPVQPPVTPPTTPPVTPPQVKGAEALPATGVSGLFAPIAAIGSGALAYAGRLFVIKRRK
jgi:uncharacterized repeat protein (TIGR01451 family)